jgi:FKBP-type peptidyl-prolyl cis-trans isomerase FklB
MKKSIITLGILSVLAFSANAQIKLKSTLDSISYSIGVNIARSLQQQSLDSVDPYVMVKGINDVFGSRQLDVDEAKGGALIQKFMVDAKSKKLDKNKAISEKFLTENKKKKGVIVTASGLQYEILTKGTGVLPKSTDKVTVHYVGTLIDGRKFDSSIDRGQPATFPVTGVIKGWVEALQLMPVGSKWRLYIPADLAYGQNPQPGGIIEPNMALLFDVELLKIDNQ